MMFHRQGTQQQRPETPTVTQPGMRVNARSVNSIKGTSSNHKIHIFFIISYNHKIHVKSCSDTS